MNVSGQRQLERIVEPGRDQLVDVVVDERAADGVDPRGPGWAARAASTIGSTGSRRACDALVVARDAGDDPDGRPVGGHQPGLGRDLERVRDLVERRRRGAVDVGAGGLEGRRPGRRPPPGRPDRSAAPGPPATTTRNCSYGSLVPPALKTSYASLASSWRSFGSALTSPASMPPIAMLATNSPIVAANQRIDDRPAVARAPHRDSDGGGLAAGRTRRLVGGHGLLG